MQNKNASGSSNNLQQINSLPFFARFLESQHAAGDNRCDADLMQSSNTDNQRSLKYPSDRDEIDLH